MVEKKCRDSLANSMTELERVLEIRVSKRGKNACSQTEENWTDLLRKTKQSIDGQFNHHLHILACTHLRRTFEAGYTKQNRGQTVTDCFGSQGSGRWRQCEGSMRGKNVDQHSSEPC
jgi:hypothetical protein